MTQLTILEVEDTLVPKRGSSILGDYDDELLKVFLTIRMFTSRAHIRLAKVRIMAIDDWMGVKFGARGMIKDGNFL